MKRIQSSLRSLWKAQRTYSRIAVLLAIALGSLPMTSCSDEEIAVGATVVAAGAVVASIAAGGRVPPPREYRRREERVFRSYRDYRGDWVEECEMVTRTDSCGGRSRRHDNLRSFLSSTEVSLSSQNVESVPVRDNLDAVDIADEYYLSLSSAERFLDALELSRKGNLEAISDLGLSKEDVDLMARLRMPSQEGFYSLARDLNQDPVMKRGMIGGIVSRG